MEWRDGFISQVLALQAKGPEINPQNTCETRGEEDGSVVCASSPTAERGRGGGRIHWPESLS